MHGGHRVIRITVVDESDAGRPALQSRNGFGAGMRQQLVAVGAPAVADAVIRAFQLARRLALQQQFGGVHGARREEQVRGLQFIALDQFALRRDVAAGHRVALRRFADHLDFGQAAQFHVAGGQRVAQVVLVGRELGVAVTAECVLADACRREEWFPRFPGE